MNLLSRIFKRTTDIKAFEYRMYPYQNQTDLIENLKRGILFESVNVFIPWETSYNKLERYGVQVKEGGDRIIYNFGVQKILNGLELELLSMQWQTTNGNASFGSVDASLGQDQTGRANAQKIKEHLIRFLGKPSKENQAGDWEMSVEWVFGKVKISIVGWEHFAVKYNLKAGLIDEPNWSFLKK